MADIWPNDAYVRLGNHPDEPLRPFQCLILMPFDSKRFEDLARRIENTVRNVTESLLPTVQIGPARIERLDWVDSAGVIHHQLWERMAEADLVFCDLTGQNPNVLFEAGVCAAWKRVEQVVFLRDNFYRPEQPFDIAPVRYVSYQLTSDGYPIFEKRLQRIVLDAVIGFPHRESLGVSPISLSLPVTMDFGGNREDDRLLTPPLSHRRVRAGCLEFGSLWSFPHSWASVGRVRVGNFKLHLTARFAKLHPGKDHGYIGVGFRSQHPLVPFCHVVYLNRDGSIKMACPNDGVEHGYEDMVLREPRSVDLSTDHEFEVTLTSDSLTITIDDSHHSFAVANLPQLLGPGLIRCQAHMAWMGIRRLVVSATDE